MDWWVFPLVGAFGGFLAGLIGIGGGIIITPILMLLLPTPLQAIATSLASMILPTSVSTYLRVKQQSIEFKIYQKMFPGLLIGSFLGAYLAREADKELLKTVFGLFSLLVSLFFFNGTPKTSLGSNKMTRSGELFLFGLGTASVASFLGIGGGIIATIYYFFSGISIKSMLGITTSLSLTITLIAVLPLLNQVDFMVFLSIAPLSVLFAYIGFKISNLVEKNLLEKVLGFFLLIVGLVLLWPNLYKVISDIKFGHP